MAEAPTHSQQGLITRRDQPLIGIPISAGADEIVRYFTDEDEADQALARNQDSIQRALSLAGAWEALDAEDGPDMLEELDRLRHQSQPSPPLEL